MYIWKTPYKIQTIEIQFVIYLFDSINRHFASHGLEITLFSKFLDSFTNSTDEDKNFKIRQLFYLFKLQ